MDEHIPLPLSFLLVVLVRSSKLPFNARNLPTRMETRLGILIVIDSGDKRQRSQIEYNNFHHQKKKKSKNREMRCSLVFLLCSPSLFLSLPSLFVVAGALALGLALEQAAREDLAVQVDFSLRLLQRLEQAQRHAHKLVAEPLI